LRDAPVLAPVVRPGQPGFKTRQRSCDHTRCRVDVVHLQAQVQAFIGIRQEVAYVIEVHVGQVGTDVEVDVEDATDGEAVDVQTGLVGGGRAARHNEVHRVTRIEPQGVGEAATDHDTVA